MYRSEKLKILYFPVPKIGCTTTKRALHIAENNKIIKGDIHKISKSHVFKNIDFEDINIDDYYKFCIVRDPVKRFISIYNGRILGKKDLQNNTDLLKKFNLPQKPSLSQFVNRIETYRKNKSVDHHVKPQVAFLGKDSNFYDDIFNLKDINTIIIPKLESMCGFKIEFDMTKNKSEKIATIDELNVNQIKKIKDLYAKDYEVFGSYF